MAGWDIREVLDRTDLAALLDETSGPASRLSGSRRWHCPVPDHVDHHPSVTLHTDQRGHERWRCWSGDDRHRGDAIDLMTVTRGVGRADAIDLLAARAGMLPDRPLPPVLPKRPAPERAKMMDPAVDRYVRVCARVLSGPQGEPVRAWLAARGISEDVAKANLVGTDPGRKLLRRQPGLPWGKEVAATFPALDAAGKVAYVQARYLEPDRVGRKYENPSGAMAPNPRVAFAQPPAGLHESGRSGVLMVCEGIPDALIAAQAGFRAAGVMGAEAPNEAMAARIAAVAANEDLTVVVVAEPNPAGHEVTDTLPAMLTDEGISSNVVTPPDGLDLNDWALRDQSWARAVDRQFGVDEPGQDPAELRSEGVELG